MYFFHIMWHLICMPLWLLKLQYVDPHCKSAHKRIIWPFFPIVVICLEQISPTIVGLYRKVCLSIFYLSKYHCNALAITEVPKGSPLLLHTLSFIQNTYCAIVLSQSYVWLRSDWVWCEHNVEFYRKIKHGIMWYQIIFHTCEWNIDFGSLKQNLSDILYL